jgi:hypothetical protein
LSGIINLAKRTADLDMRAWAITEIKFGEIVGKAFIISKFKAFDSINFYKRLHKVLSNRL